VCLLIRALLDLLVVCVLIVLLILVWVRAVLVCVRVFVVLLWRLLVMVVVVQWIHGRIIRMCAGTVLLAVNCLSGLI